MGKPTKRWSEMKRVVEEFRGSGLTRREFCGRRGITLTTFDYWRRQFRGKPRLVEVEVARAEAAARSFTLRLANGRSIESWWGCGEEELAQLIRIAERA